jgi:hypothetical protein
MAKFKLIARIKGLSESSNWEEARNEWEFVSLRKVEVPSSCLCGHSPIVNICTIKNKLNGKETKVGNCCITKFNNENLSSNKMFSAINRVENDRSKALNKSIVNLSRGNKWINDWEQKFYLNTWRKRKLSTKQLDMRKKINDKILDRVR